MKVYQLVITTDLPKFGRGLKDDEFEQQPRKRPKIKIQYEKEEESNKGVQLEGE